MNGADRDVVPRAGSDGVNVATTEWRPLLTGPVPMLHPPEFGATHADTWAPSTTSQ